MSSFTGRLLAKYTSVLRRTMTIFVAAVLVYMSCGATGQVWTPHNATSVWDCQSVRKPINTTIILEKLESASLTGCSHHCANTAASGVKPVSLYFDTEDQLCYCNSEVDVDVGNEFDVEIGVDDDVLPELKYCKLNTSLKIDKTDNQNTRRSLWPYNHDCMELYDYLYYIHFTRLGNWSEELADEFNHATEGVHVIYPGGEGGPVDVWCHMLRGGPTVVQRRLGGTENFNRSWADFVNGFGDLTGDHWLGLKYMHRLTKKGMLLNIELNPAGLKEPVKRGPSTPAEWEEPLKNWPSSLQYYGITVSNESSNYMLQHGYYFSYMDFLGRYGIRDILHGKRELHFSTYDNDNDDDSDRNLAAETHSGWWFGNLSEENPNRPYMGRGENDLTTWELFRWSGCNDLPDWSVNKTLMMLQPNDNVPTGFKCSQCC